MLVKIKNLLVATSEQVLAVQNLADLEVVRTEVLGRKGSLTEVLRGIKDLVGEERARVGAEVNEVKVKLQEVIENKNIELKARELQEILKSEQIDTTLMARDEVVSGAIHPLNRVRYEVEDIFMNLGFTMVDGPEIESEYYNFDTLNIPRSHPARDLWDTFFLGEGCVLRTHTSPVQIRAMEELGAPLKVITSGRCYRNEAVDANHEHTLNQVEGLVIDEDISVANMKDILEQFLSQIFERVVQVRLRPAYFPFVKPGMEVDFSCQICAGKGCATCKYSGWLEFMGCGMVHPHVLRAGGIDPDRYQGFAFGFGLDRLVMMKYKIPDIRSFAQGDVRFLTQFT